MTVAGVSQFEATLSVNELLEGSELLKPREMVTEATAPPHGLQERLAAAKAFAQSSDTAATSTRDAPTTPTTDPQIRVERSALPRPPAASQQWYGQRRALGCIPAPARKPSAAELAEHRAACSDAALAQAHRWATSLETALQVAKRQIGSLETALATESSAAHGAQAAKHGADAARAAAEASRDAAEAVREAAEERAALAEAEAASSRELAATAKEEADAAIAAAAAEVEEAEEEATAARSEALDAAAEAQRARDEARESLAHAQNCEADADASRADAEAARGEAELSRAELEATLQQAEAAVAQARAKAEARVAASERKMAKQQVEFEEAMRRAEKERARAERQARERHEHELKAAVAEAVETIENQWATEVARLAENWEAESWEAARHGQPPATFANESAEPPSARFDRRAAQDVQLKRWMERENSKCENSKRPLGEHESSRAAALSRAAESLAAVATAPWQAAAATAYAGIAAMDTTALIEMDTETLIRASIDSLAATAREREALAATSERAASESSSPDKSAGNSSAAGRTRSERGSVAMTPMRSGSESRSADDISPPTPHSGATAAARGGERYRSPHKRPQSQRRAERAAVGEALAVEAEAHRGADEGPFLAEPFSSSKVPPEAGAHLLQATHALQALVIDAIVELREIAAACRKSCGSPADAYVPFGEPPAAAPLEPEQQRAMRSAALRSEALAARLEEETNTQLSRLVVVLSDATSAAEGDDKAAEGDDKAAESSDKAAERGGDPADAENRDPADAENRDPADAGNRDEGAAAAARAIIRGVKQQQDGYEPFTPFSAKEVAPPTGESPLEESPPEAQQQPLKAPIAQLKETPTEIAAVASSPTTEKARPEAKSPAKGQAHARRTPAPRLQRLLELASQAQQQGSSPSKPPPSKLPSHFKPLVIDDSDAL